MSASSRRNVLILSLTLVVMTLGFGLVIPILPFYIAKMGASGTHLGLLTAIAAFTELLFSPVWGGVSDRIGRKPILLVGVLGYALSLLLFGLSTEVWMLFASRAVSGILSAATSVTALAYIGDSTGERERGGGLGMLGAAMGLGTVIGPGVGGLLGGRSLSLPFFVGAGLAFVALLLVAFLLPESLPAQARQKPAKVGSASRIGQLWQALRGPAGILWFLLFLASFGLINFEAIFGLYAAQKLGYGPERVGAILMVVGVVSTAGKATLIGPLTRRWGEAPIIKTSLLASAVGFCVLLLASTYPGVLLATGLFILSKTLLRTVVMSLISKRVTLGQGTTMGLSNLFMNLGRIAGPIWAGFIFDVNVDYPYLSGAAIMLIGFIVSLIWVSQGTTGATGAGPKPVAT